MLKNIKIYTAGKMTGLRLKEQMQWRSELCNSIRELIDPSLCKVEVFCPPLYYNDNNFQSDNEVMEYDLARMKSSDIVVVNLDNLKTSIGTIMELATAKEHNMSGGKHIFVIGIGEKEEQHPWVRCCVHRFVSGTKEAAEFINEFFCN